MKLTQEQKDELLRQRGFTEEEIENNLYDYLHGRTWRITSLSPQEAASSYDSEVLGRFFVKDSIPYYRFDVPDVISGFEGFRAFPATFDIPTAELDPYVAAFARAINLCGIQVGMSCDGWHKKYDCDDYREIKFWMKDRYSTIWFWIIMEFVLGENWRGNGTHSEYASWVGIWEPVMQDSETNKQKIVNGYSNERSMMVYQIEQGKEKEAYAKTYKYARLLMERYKKIVEIREKVIEGLLADHSNADIEVMGFMAVRREMLKHCEKELTDLGRG